MVKVAFSQKGLLFRFFIHFSSLFRGKMEEKQAKNAHFFLKSCHVILNLVICSAMKQEMWAFLERVFKMAAFSDYSSTFPLNPFREKATFNTSK